MEIERKWLIKEFPGEVYQISHSESILQGYISIDPEVRIRKSNNSNSNSNSNSGPRYYLSIKSTGHLSRMEVEIPIGKENYTQLLNLVPNHMIVKDYRIYEFAGYKIEMSRVDSSWYYAEVEFETEEEAKNFEFPFPSLIIKEVTYDENYKMKNYWKSTRIAGISVEVQNEIRNMTKDNIKYLVKDDSKLVKIDGPSLICDDDNNPIKCSNDIDYGALLRAYNGKDTTT